MANITIDTQSAGYQTRLTQIQEIKTQINEYTLPIKFYCLILLLILLLNSYYLYIISIKLNKFSFSFEC